MEKLQKDPIQVLLLNRKGIFLREITPYYSSFFDLLGDYLSVYRVRSRTHYSVAIPAHHRGDLVQGDTLNLLAMRHHYSIVFLGENLTTNTLISLSNDQKNEINQVLNSGFPSINIY